MKNDQQLKADVEMELRWEPSVHAERIGVSAKGGVVQLDGQVDSYYEKWAARLEELLVRAGLVLREELAIELD